MGMLSELAAPTATKGTKRPTSGGSVFKFNQINYRIKCSLFKLINNRTLVTLTAALRPSAVPRAPPVAAR